MMCTDIGLVLLVDVEVEKRVEGSENRRSW